jgi:3-(methylthio)propionyl---CoA ligase
MRSTMMQQPLLVSSIIRHAAVTHGATDIVSRVTGGALHRTCYAEVARRSEGLARALVSLGLVPGDRVGTLAWNDHRHLEIYYGAAGAGFVCHTINPRLFAEQIAFIVNHAADRILFVDPAFVGLVASMRERLHTVEQIIVMCDADAMPPEAEDHDFVCYEMVLDVHAGRFEWPELDERDAAGLCYTSGTTGDPKGVLYSHRSIVLHAMAACAPDVFALGSRSVAMPVVPMFHVNGWGIPHAAPMVGARLVLPGQRLDPASLHSLISSEQVTFTAGVPTLWGPLLDWISTQGLDLASLTRVAIGGSACPQFMAERFRVHGVEVLHAWGMTETSPVGLANASQAIACSAQGDADEQGARLKQGRPLFGVAVRIVDADGRLAPHDGVSSGRLQVRGPWIASDYFLGVNAETNASTPDTDGWFDTGDIATIDSASYVEIVDRAKDVIKSGGEWISSVLLENVAMSHPDVLEAAAIARPDARWGERPVLIVVRREGVALTRDALLAHYSGKVARWCVPDDVLFVRELPHTATGKVLKARLRQHYDASSTGVPSDQFQGA